MECKKCGHENPDGIAYCGNCGCRVGKKGRGPGIPVAVVLIIAVLVAGVCFVGGREEHEEPVLHHTEPTTATEAPAETEPETTGPVQTEPTETEPAETEPTETEPPEMEEQTPEERLPNVPEEWLEHILLHYRDAGSCEVLRDEVVVTVFFVEDPESVWTEEELALKQTELEEAARIMMEEAARYGVPLELRLVYYEVSSLTTDMEDEDDWANAILTDAGMPGIYEINQELEQTHGVEAAPVVFLLNRPGRAHASWNDAPMGREYLVLFGDAHGFRHELCHLFGAVDYYYPTIVKEQAKVLFPDSLMAASEVSVVDSMTAYLIGWTDELSADAMTFLEATEELTWETFWGEMGDQYYTGYIEKVMDYGTYAGDMVDGMLHGYGKLVWNSGATYEGEWSMGQQHGQGTYIAADGSSFVGQWQNGSIHGYGVYTWASGTTYDGYWENGTQNGQGTMKWSDGTVYTGEWKDGKCHGQGTMSWPSGTVQSGTWENGEFVG